MVSMSPNPVNPEAGHHPMPTDPGELEAAIRAGRRCWDEFPYFDQRYGERGWRFTMSDSGWLVTLADGRPQPEVDHHLEWLGRILSSRGMPTLLLERHLLLIVEELTAQFSPERARRYEPLRMGAQHLATRREAHLPAALGADLASRFDAAVGHHWSRRLPQTGHLIAAAVADRALGISKAVDSLVDWLSDTARFPDVWTDAVHATVWTAEEALKSPAKTQPARMAAAR